MKHPNLHAPHIAMPHFGRRAAHGPPEHEGEHEHHHHRPAYQILKQVEGSVDILVIALIVILALAMIYGLVTASGHPAYFDRVPGAVG